MLQLQLQGPGEGNKSEREAIVESIMVGIKYEASR